MSKFQSRIITVAIVEDDPMVSRITEEFLAKVSGYLLKATYDSIEKAKEGILENPPKLLLLDVFFSKSSGIELLKWSRKFELDMDVILITADHSTETIEKAMRYGAIDYLVKPFRFARFEEALLNYKNVIESFREGEVSSQEIIDSILNKNATVIVQEKEVSEVAKGYQNITYKLILDYLKTHKELGVTASSLGEELKIARITARRYLDKMEHDGIVDIHSEYGSIGRPKNYYRIKGD
jgi:response regulator of citrate/malate metabolism